MDVVGLQREQLRIRLGGHLASEGQVEADGCRGRGGRDVQAPRSPSSGFDLGQAEQMPPPSLMPIPVADVKERELELVPCPADEVALQHRGADEALVVEEAVQPSAVIMAGLEDGRVLLGLARRPAPLIDALRP